MASPIQRYDDYSSSGPIVAAQASVSDRTTFILKVYGLVFVGLIIFFASALIPTIGLFMGVPGLSEFAAFFVQLNPLISMLLILGTSFAVHWIANIPGINLLGLAGFSALWGFLTINLIAYACFKMAPAGAQGVEILGPGLLVVSQAAALTFLAMGLLTAYVFISKQDFNFLGGFLFVGMIMMIIAVLAAIVIPMMGFTSFLGVEFNILYVGLSIVSVLLMVGYILYDTSNVLHHYPTTMAVAAALALLSDFIILFRNILFLLLNRR
ncbi:MAG: Bax inhibitor-1 family protein [Candidatus Sumerlaeia bacterium]|nr:Bax inhibitor-1 family protein [Candidatus Sumerlaeia bacterium]